MLGKSLVNEQERVLIHRARDFDSIIRNNKKIKIGAYIFLRQLSKALKFDEKKLKNLLVENKSKLNNLVFTNRPETLDFLFSSKYYEPETTKFILSKKGEIFLDIGAHIGRMSLLASKNFTKIYSFEPHESTFQVLNKNIKTNKIKNIFPMNFPISKKVESFTLSELEMNTGATKILKSNKKKSKKSETLTTFINKNKISPKLIKLIKIDVEGHELEVLEGGKEFLKNNNPTIILESFNVGEIENFLSKLGYKKTKVLDFYNFVFEKSK